MCQISVRGFFSVFEIFHFPVSVCLSVCPCICLSVCPCVCLPSLHLNLVQQFIILSYYSINYSLTQTLTHSLPPSLTPSHTDSLPHSLTHSLPLSHSLTHSLPLSHSPGCVLRAFTLESKSGRSADACRLNHLLRTKASPINTG